MSSVIMANIMRRDHLPPYIKLLMLVMANYAADDGMFRMPVKDLCERTGMSPSLLSTVMNLAEKRQLMLIEDQPDDGFIIAYEIGGAAIEIDDFPTGSGRVKKREPNYASMPKLAVSSRKGGR